MSLSTLRRLLLMATVTLLLGACGDDGTKPRPLTLGLSPSSLSLAELETVQLSADVGGPAGAVVTWASSDDDVATVDTGGRVTGVAAGTATVTATATVGAESAVGSAAITVTPLPLAIAIDRFLNAGEPVPADRLGLGTSAEVVYDVPAHFEGFIEIRAGDEVLGRIDVPVTPDGSPEPVSKVVVTARKGVRADVPLTFTALRGGSIEPVVTNNLATPLTARIGSNAGTNPGGSVESGAFTTSFRIARQFAVTSIDAPRSVTDPFGRRWIGGPTPLIVLNGQIVDFSAIPGDLSGDVSVTVLKGTQATALYGVAGVDGVVRITIRDELSDQEGEFRFGDEASWSGGAEPLPVLNAEASGIDGSALPRAFDFDGAPASFPDLDLSGAIWLQPGPVAPQLSERIGLRTESDAFGAPTIVDFGVGGASAQVVAGTTPDLELGDIAAFDDAFLALAAGLFLGIDVTDDIDNFRRWVLSTRQGAPVRFGIDPTAPAAPIFATGPGFTVPGVVNPASLLVGWSAMDRDPGSGIDPEGYRISFEYRSPSAAFCLIGFGTECAPEPAPAGAQHGFTPDVPIGISAEFRLGVGASDLATNLGAMSYADWVYDALPIQGSGTPSVGTPSNGDLPVTGFHFIDELEVAWTAVVAQYSMGAQTPIHPIYLSSRQVGSPFDGSFETEAPAMVDMPHLTSLETTETASPMRPTGIIYPMAAVTVLAGDHAGHTASVFTTEPGVAPRSTSFLAGGMDHFAIRTAPGTICNPTPSNGANCNGAPTSVDVTVEAFTLGASFEIAEVMLIGSQSDPGNPIGVADWTSLAVMDRGTFGEGTATFTLDGAALQLSGGFLDLWAIARDPAGGGILSQKVRYTTVF